jgi:hypothetical protein
MSLTTFDPKTSRDKCKDKIDVHVLVHWHLFHCYFSGVVQNVHHLSGLLLLIFSSPDPAIVTTERPSIRPLTFHILINSSEATGPI